MWPFKVGPQLQNICHPMFIPIIYFILFPGWEMFDPFIPVEVPPFDEGETDVMIDYYLHKR